MFKRDPAEAVMRSDDVMALAARRTVLHRGRHGDVGLLKSYLRQLYGGQSRDGSWSGSTLDTLQALFILHVLGEESSSKTESALDWLLTDPMVGQRRRCGDGAEYFGLFGTLERKDRPRMRDLRGHFLNTGCAAFIKVGGAIAAAAWFDMADDKRIMTALKCLDAVLRVRGGAWCSAACSNNILRAYVEHPKRAYSRHTRRAVKWLEKQQSKGGTWVGTSFYRTLNTIAQVNIMSSRKQVERAIPRLRRSQNEDGTWGKSHKWLKTYFTLDALAMQDLLYNSS